MEESEFAARLWAEIREAGTHLGIYADVHRAIHVYGEDAAQRVGDFHVARARAQGFIR